MLPHTAPFRLAFTVRVAIITPRVSGTGDVQCTSPYYTLLSNCVAQRTRAWPLPALLFLSEPVCRSVGRRPEARAHGGKLEGTRPHPLRHPSRRISLGSRQNSARCARTAPDSPLRVVSALTRLRLRYSSRIKVLEPQTKRFSGWRMESALPPSFVLFYSEKCTTLVYFTASTPLF
jgi:hypothetical protein